MKKNEFEKKEYTKAEAEFVEFNYCDVCAGTGIEETNAPIDKPTQEEEYFPDDEDDEDDGIWG